MDWWDLFWSAFGAIGTTLGAVATFIAILVALWQTRTAYKKKVNIVFADNANVMLEDKLVPVVIFTINNVGNKDIVISNLKYTVKKHDVVILPSYLKIKTIQFPYELKQEHSASLVMQRDDFVRTLCDITENNKKLMNSKIKITITDGVDQRYILKLNKKPSYYLLRKQEGTK